MDEKEWWEDVDTSQFDHVDFSYFLDAMTQEEYDRYINGKDK